ncbi:hypothetical protein LAUMK13_03329 [Mycobacterium innocens]|uniref:Uncharacterized protein n=1 Tax=Mycobacterium innocens TaxID=2341083 RepID=A0A498Q482_9MYCO|nr:hypothetical protein LAUMK13_03329 [Mycobacterium innocens]
MTSRIRGHHEFPSEPGKSRTRSAKNRCYQRDCRNEDSGERGNQVNAVPPSSIVVAGLVSSRPRDGLSAVADFADNIDLATGARSPGKACIRGDQYDVESLGKRNVGGIVGRQDMPQFPYPVEQWLM